ncbi:MAG TPA: META domain-containing protein [Solirubrobacteraceae bacterium]|nr:META domain-containing protein [Solirubrobacteraceae bacterium]
MRWLVAVAGVAAVIGCGEEDGGGASAAGAQSFEDIAWTLVAPAGPSATFTDGKVGGSTGCNQFGASYTQDGDALTIGEIVSTQMACGSKADAVERAYLAALERVASWRLEQDQLTLADADGRALLHFREASPAGSWTATMIRQPDAVSSLVAGTEITADFDDAGKLTGSAGCNTYSGTYETDGAKITIGEVSATEMACDGPDGVMEQEQAYLSALPLAAGYRVEGSKLSLLTAEGTYVATYQRAP